MFAQFLKGAMLVGALFTCGCASIDRHETVVPWTSAKVVAGSEVWEWKNFCAREPVECAPHPGKRVVPFAIAHAVNERVNSTVRYVPDMQAYGVMDYWAIPRNGYGDCEDFALMKRSLLWRAGYDSRALKMVTLVSDEGRHAVLVVTTEKGDVVLDNRSSYPELLSRIGMHVVSVEVGGEWYRFSHYAVAGRETAAGD